MCGIAAAVDTQRRGRTRPWAGPLIAHRGPDSAGCYTDDAQNVALEHTRLAIIDPDNREADQPFWDESGRWALVFNGEIFNFRALRAELERAGAAFRTNSDTEVVLAGFRIHGEAFVPRLRGMFAFVIWDSLTGNLFAARDQVGVKPFYYFFVDGVFAACSEVRPLMAYPGFTRDFDAQGVVEFLAFGQNFGERTLVDHLRKLPPGHHLRVEGDRLTVTEYWDALPPRGDTIDERGAPQEMLGQLDDAVRSALVSDVPVGLMLSGGLDSSAIAALAARHSDPASLTAYSVSFGLPDDESNVAARLASNLGLNHRVVMLTEDRLRGEFDSWLTTLDYPGDDPTWIATAAIARAAHEDGIKVLLSGDGGDELFGGYNRWMKYLRFHDTLWERTPSRLRRLGGRFAAPAAGGLAGDIARRARAGGHLFVPSRPFHDDLLMRTLGSVGRDAATRSHPELVLKPLEASYAAWGQDGYLSWMSYVVLKTKLVENFLQRLDKMGMTHSVEGRVPLLDPELVRWSFRLSQRAKVGRGSQKLLFRQAVEGLLPRYILDRPKQGFCPPVAAWGEELLARQARVVGSPLVEAGIVRAGALEELRASKGDSFAAWTLGTLFAWSERAFSTEATPVPA